MRLLHEGRIEGTFKGWKRDAVYKLSDGNHYEIRDNVSQSSEAQYPAAKLWQDGSTYFLEVEGMGKPVEVRLTRRKQECD